MRPTTTHRPAGRAGHNFMCQSSEQEVYDRTMRMLERTADRGGWAVGTGNSVPEYLPPRNIFAMQRAARDFQGKKS